MSTRSSNIIFDILAKDNASKVFDAVTKKADEQQKSMKALKTAGTAQFVALTAAAGMFAVGSVKAYAESEQSQRQLANALAMFPRLADTNVAALDKLDAALMKKTGYDDDAIASAQGVLAQFNLTGKQLEELTPLLVDYASRTGQDLPTAAEALGKGLMGQTRALKAVGVEMVNTGTTTGNYEQLVVGLRKQVGGFAENEAKSAIGQTKMLQTRYEELQESVGKKLLPDLLALAEAGNDVLTWIDENQGAAEALAITVGVLSTAIAVAANWQKITTTYTTLATAAEWLYNTAKGASNAAVAASIPLKVADAEAEAASMAAIMGLTTTTAASTAATAARNIALGAAIPLEVAGAEAKAASMAAIMGLTTTTAASTAATVINTDATVTATVATKGYAGSLRTLAKGGAYVGVALIGLGAISDALSSITLKTGNLADDTNALLDISGGADVANTSLSKLTDYSGWDKFLTGGKDINSVADAMERVSSSTQGMAKAQTWLADAMHITGATQGDLVQARETVSSLDEALTALVQQGAAGNAAAAISKLGISADDVAKFLPTYTAALAAAGDQAGVTADATGAANEVTAEAIDKAKANADAVLSLVDALAKQIDKQRQLSGKALDENSALRGYKQSIDDVTAALTKNGAGLDVNTQQGRDNQAALDAVASSTWDWVDAGKSAGVSQVDLAARMAAGRQAFIDSAAQMGLTTTEASALADKLNLIPSNVVTNVTLAGYPQVYAYLSDIQTRLRSITGDAHIRIATGVGGSGGLAFADGGAIRGPGTSTSDSIHIRASNGEYMQSAAAHAFVGTQAMDALNNRNIPGFLDAIAGARYAGGGSIADSVYTGVASSNPYQGLSTQASVAATSTSGDVTFILNLFDTDDVFKGTMRAVAVDQSRAVAEGRNAAVRRR